MDKLKAICEGAIKIAETSMQKEGFCNPKVVLFYRDDRNELGTYMIDLAPQSYFDSRETIMEKVGTFLATKKEKGVRSFDTLISYGEATATIDGIDTPVIMATAMDDMGKTVSKFKEIQRYILPDHPEKQFFNLNQLDLKGFTYKSKTLETLLTSYNKK